MVLSLPSPVSSNFIKDFPTQNAVNLDAIDAYAGPCLITHGLRTWTPQLTAITTDPVLGTGGVIKGYYYKIFDQVWAWGEFRFGATGASFGSGIWTVTVPFPIDTLAGNGANPLTIGEWPVIGEGVCWDNSATNGQPLLVMARSSTQVSFGTRFNALTGREVLSTSPMTWAASDGITWNMRYKALP